MDKQLHQLCYADVITYAWPKTKLGVASIS